MHIIFTEHLTDLIHKIQLIHDNTSNRPISHSLKTSTHLSRSRQVVSIIVLNDKVRGQEGSTLNQFLVTREHFTENLLDVTIIAFV